MLTGLRTDLTAARRSLFKNPTYAAFAAICLALGIGATTAVFSVVNAFLLQPLPFEDPSRLISIWATVYGSPEDGQFFVDPKTFTELEEISEGFEVGGTLQLDLNVSLEAESRRVRSVYATSNLFDLLGVPLLLGRSITLEEERAQERVCVISEDFWRDDLGGRAGIVGETLHLNSAEYVVVGVAPRQSYPDQVHIWIPVTSAVREGRSGLLAMGRLQPGMTLDAARQELLRTADYLREKDPVENGSSSLAGGHFYGQIYDADLDDNLWALLAVVGFLLAIACANVASLLLVRLQSQKPELAVQAALGAGRSRLLRRVLTESALLAALGTVLGVMLALAVTPALVALSPAEVPRFRAIELDLRVLGFAAVLAFGTLLVFSVPPAWRAAAAEPAAALGRLGRGSARSLSTFQRLLAIVNVALALVLLAGAGLMLGSFWRLQSTGPGFRPAGLYRARIVAPAALAETHEGRAGFIREVEESLGALPGVEAVGSTHSFPLGGIQYWVSFLLEDRPEQSADEADMAVFQLVTPGYFEALGLHPLIGRLLEPTDTGTALRVAVVSQAFAGHYWPGGDPVGKRLRRSRASLEKEGWWTIVGVVPDQKDRGLGEEIGPSIYFSQTQLERAYTSRMDLFVRAAGSALEGMPTAIREGIRSVEPDGMVYDVAPMTEVMAETLQRERFSAVLTAILGGLALVLAGAGIYGVISYGVSQRKGELGVRMAFGARAGDLKRLVVGQSMRGVLLGVFTGNVVVLMLGRLIGSQLYETEPYDPLTLAAASGLILVTALVASYLPARRTTKLAPTEALRS